ncbi:MAG TPA: hypothetical protein VI981_05845 [Candidatus Paceibacterota bacterium]
MNGKHATLLIIFILLIVFAGLGIFFFTLMRENKPVDVPTTEEKDITIDFGGRGTPPIAQPEPQGGQNNDNLSSSPLATLRKISSLPQAGAVAIDIENETEILFVDQATGHVFRGSTEDPSISRISNTTIPKITEALWLASGTGFIARYLDQDGKTIQSYSATLIPRATSTIEDTGENSVPFKIEGKFLPRNLKVLIPSESDDLIFYIPEGERSVGYTAKNDETKRTEVFNSDLGEWQIAWPKATHLALTTKPSGTVRGTLYLHNLKTKVTEKIMDGLGLTALINNSLSRVLYANPSEKEFGLKVLSIKDHAVTNLGSGGLPEKCVWSKKEDFVVYCAIPKAIPGALYPDMWYQGIVSFNDTIWQLNLKNGSTIELADPEKETGEMMDAVRFFLNGKEDSLFFTNKRDNTLWSISLKESARK